jgi:UTP--glucose-1-phosphate uridylyltransferase
MTELARDPAQPFYAVRFDGTIYDCGMKQGFLLANVAYGLECDDVGPTLRAGLEALLRRH